jgi:chromosomal replication initiation ATPase DnaA
MTRREQNLADIAEIAAAHGTTTAWIFSRIRLPKIVKARYHCFWHLRGKGYSFPKIAIIMGGLHHTSVMYGVAQHEGRLAVSDKNKPQ